MQASAGRCRCPHRDPAPRHRGRRSVPPLGLQHRGGQPRPRAPAAGRAGADDAALGHVRTRPRRRRGRRADRRGGQGRGLEGGRGHLDARDRHPRGIGPGLSDGHPRQPRLDEHHQRHVGIDAGAEGDERQERLDGRRRVPAARPLRPRCTRRRAPADRRQAGDDDRRRDRHSRADQGGDEARLALRARQRASPRSTSTSTTSA